MDEQRLSRREIVLTMVAVMTALLLSALDSTIVGTAMPKIIADLNGMNRYGWPFTAYMLVSTVAIALFGKLADIWGRKTVFLVGIGIFLGASVLCGLSTTMTMLIVCRGLQGAGGGVIVSSAFIIVGGMFPPRERGRYMGILSSVFGLSSVLGPAIGGLITDAISWRWVFYVNVPIGLVAVVLISFGMRPIPPREEKLPLDVAGAVLLLVGTFSLLLGITWGGGEYPWSSTNILCALGIGVVALAVLVPVELRARDPVIPVTCFRDWTFTGSVLVSFFSSAAMFCAIIYIALFIQGVLGASASLSGGATTPMMLGLAVASIFTGQAVSALGRYKAAALLGFLANGLGFVLLALMGPSTPLYLVLLDTVMVGIGMGMAIPIFNITAQNAFGQRELATVTASIQFFRNIGAAMGSALLSFVLSIGMNARAAHIQTVGMPEKYAGALTNPRILSSPTLLSEIISKAPESAHSLILKIVAQTRDALAGSLRTVFLIGAGVVVVCMGITLAMREVPLKRFEGENEEWKVGGA